MALILGASRSGPGARPGGFWEKEGHGWVPATPSCQSRGRPRLRGRGWGGGLGGEVGAAPAETAPGRTSVSWPLCPRGAGRGSPTHSDALNSSAGSSPLGFLRVYSRPAPGFVSRADCCPPGSSASWAQQLLPRGDCRYALGPWALSRGLANPALSPGGCVGAGVGALARGPAAGGDRGAP